METTVGQRLKIIAESKGLTTSMLAEALKISQPALSNIFNNRSKPHKSTLRNLIETYSDINEEWLFAGRGEMLKAPGQETSINWKDEAYNTIKEENTYLKKQLEVLNNVITNLLQQGKPNFRKANLQAAKFILESQGTLAGGLGLRKVA